MDIEEKQRKAKWQLQKELDIVVNAWKEIPTNEIPQETRNSAFFYGR